MAFKSLKDYNEEKFGGLFLLRNDGDYADVVFLYPREEDVLVGDVHYIKSAEYSGYVQCTGKGCPACAKGIRVQTKLFIPVFNITAGEVQFWDRGIRFEMQLRNDVFKNFPNPTEYVFRVTRHGIANSVDTTYEIVAIGKNGAYPYAQILEENHVEFPKYYENICRDYTSAKLYDLINTSPSAPSAAGDMPNYQVTPRPAPTVSAPPQVAEDVLPPSLNADDFSDIDGEVNW